MINLYDAIFHRKSTRKYDMKPLAEDKLTSIKEYVSNSIVPLEKGIKSEFIYLSKDDVKNLLPIKAPHYLCMYSEKAGKYLMNAGFMMQQADLYLSSIGIGSCWLGMAKPTKEVPAELHGMEFIIMLAFGNGLESIHRNDLSQFKRKELTEVGTAQGADDLLNAVRLAPSASNTQPWFIMGDAGQLRFYRMRLGIIKAALYDKMNQIDIGIALCHLFTAAKAMGKNAELIHEENGKATAPEGYEYMTSVRLY